MNFISRLFPLLSFLFCPLMLSLEGPGDGGGGGGGGGGGAPPAGGAPAGGELPAGGAPAGGGVDLSFLDKPLPAGWAKAAGFPEAWESKFTTLKPALGSYAGAEKLIGAKGIIKPAAGASPQEMDTYYNALGRPAKPEEYGLAKPDKITVDGKEVEVPAELWDKDAATAAQALFHQIGLTKEQAQALTMFDMQRGLKGHGAVTAAAQQAHDTAVAALKTEWKGAEYDTNLKVAKDAAAKIGLTPEILNANPAIANNPVFIRAMHAMGKMVLEQPAPGLRPGGANGGKDPASEIAAIMADKNHPWQAHNANKDRAAHDAAVKHMAMLYRLKNGEAA